MSAPVSIAPVIAESERVLMEAIKQVGSRLIKCECPACSYTVRITRKWLAVGNQTCPCGEPMEADGEEGA